MSREAFEVVTQLDALRKLTMHDCTPLKDFTAFAPMRGLQELDIAYATFDSLDGLEQLPGLRYLNLTETGIRDVSVLKAFPALARLELRHNKIQDLSPLLSLQHLQLLVLEESQRAQAKVQLSEAPFKLEIRPD